MLKDRNGNEIKPGDLLLNVSSAHDICDSWSYLICLQETQGVVIRDFNAWNLGWEGAPHNLVILGNYRNLPEVLEFNGQTIESIDKYKR